MKTILLVSLVLVTLLLPPAVEVSAGTLDQSQTLGGFLWVFQAEPTAQSFTAGISGNLDQVDVMISKDSDFLPSLPLKLEIRAASGGLPTGAALGSASIPQASIPSVVGTFVSVTIAPPVPVTLGVQYAIVMFASPGETGNFDAYYKTMNPYAGGVRSTNPGAGFVAAPNDDLAFKTYVAAGGAACAGGNIYQNLSGTWNSIPGAANFLDVDSNNGSGSAVYALGTTSTSGGCLIYKRIGGTWTNIPGGAVNLAADNTIIVVAVQDTGAIYQYNGASWANIPGMAHQVTNGAFNGGFGLHALGSTASGGNYQIYRYIGGAAVWQSIPGAASQIAWNGVDGTLWAVQASGNIYHLVAGVWQSIPGVARQVSVGYDGTVYALGTTATTGGYQMYRYVGGAAVWQAIPGGAQQLAGGGPNELWAHQ